GPQLGDQMAVGEVEGDAGRVGLPQLALRALDFDGAVTDLDGDAFRNRDWFLPNSRHLSSPNVTEDFAADTGLHGRPAGHHAARGRQDAGPQPAEHFRHILLAEVDAAAGTADALHAGDQALAVRPVLEEQRQWASMAARAVR